MKINPGGASRLSRIGAPPREIGGRASVKILLTLLVFLLVVHSGVLAAPARGEEDPNVGDPREGEAATGPVNFDTAVRQALRRSPYFTKNSLEVEIKRLDEGDSRYDLIPHVTFRTQYYVDQPSGSNSRAYSLSFRSQDYNPIESYFTLQARKMLTQLDLFLEDAREAS